MRIGGFRKPAPAEVSLQRPMEWVGYVSQLGSTAWDWRTLSRGSDVLRIVPVIYGCVSLIADRLAYLPRIIKGANGDMLPLPRWVERPNPYTTGSELVATGVVCLLQYGNWYLIPIRDRAGRVVQIVNPHPWDVSLAWVEGRVVYKIGGLVLEADEIVHTTYLSVPGTIEGVGALGASEEATEVNKQVQSFIGQYFYNGLTTQYAIKMAVNASPEDMRTVRAQVMAQYGGGSGNAWKPVITPQGTEIEQLGGVGDQKGLVDLAKWSDAKICGQIYKIDPPLMGIVQPGTQLTYNNQQEREQRLWNDALMPMAARISETYNRILNMGSLGPRFFMLDESPLVGAPPRDKMEMAVQAASINEKFGMQVIDPNEVREMVGLPVKPSFESLPMPEQASMIGRDDDGDRDFG